MQKLVKVLLTTHLNTLHWKLGLKIYVTQRRTFNCRGPKVGEFLKQIHLGLIILPSIKT